MTVETIQPDNTDDLLAFVRGCIADEQAVAIVGRNSKPALGRAVDATQQLDMSGLRGITLYEPEELVMTAKVGTPLAEIEETLAAARQYLAFEPLDLGPLYGKGPSAGTLGGLVATGLAGPRRISAGAVRDHVLGVASVTGFGELVHAGGRVVKNVTGYDIAKLVTGSYGTLGVLTELTLKVMPAPQAETTLLLQGVTDDVALAQMRAAMAGSFAISAAAYRPAWVSGVPVMAVRLEGFAVSVKERAAALKAMVNGLGDVLLLEDAASRKVWRELRQLQPALDHGGDDLWRISVPPAAGVRVMTALADAVQARCWLDWGGGLVFALVAPAQNDVASVRHIAADAGGHAMLLRGKGDPFHPLSPGTEALTKRIKSSFDPKGIFNPGRMYEGV